MGAEKSAPFYKNREVKLMANDIDLRRLVIKAFHMTEVEEGEANTRTTEGQMTISS